MSIKAWVLGGIGALVFAGLSGTAGAQTTPAPTPKPTPAAGQAPESLCANCHDQAKAFAGNPHARPFLHQKPAADPDAACISCHGDGQKHAEEGGDKSLIGGLHGVHGSTFCLTCHDKSANDHNSFGPGSTHASSATVNCLSCHSIHSPAPKTARLLAKAPGALCETCHQGQSVELRSKPYVHRLGPGAMTCLDCHNPHGRPGAGSLNLTRVGDLPCLNCHTEKRGPFVFEHVNGIAGNCMSCHELHGSTNSKMLQWQRVSQLCLSCHSRIGSAGTIGSQPPSFHNLTLPRYQNCTTCHVAVHGSNLSPQFLK